MSSPVSSSESSSFECLHPQIQQWIWSQGWTALREAQERAVPALVGADRDVIIAASTATGKTEAAFLPVLTNLLNNSEPAGAVLYISPLKALINDQWERLGRLCETLELPVVAWHGDVAASKKQRFLKSPAGILLITPESLEALFVNKGSSLPGAFQNLRYIVVDELHAFIGSERGKQLQSLMQRVELVLGRRLPRVGLSATLGEMSLARTFLRPGHQEDITVIESNSGQELQVQVRGYVERPVSQLLADYERSASAEDGAEKEEPSGTKVAIAGHLYRLLRGHNNLIFPNSRQEVEWFADRLRTLCEQDGVPNEFWPHHGSLSKELRQDAERALKAGDPAASAVCTTTLELGIDIGNIRTVAQIGCPPSVASLRQRLGRSGRRPGEPAMLRAYCQERPVTDQSDLSDQLREGLVQTIAMIRLLIRGWYEPPRSKGLHASTLVQQCLSSIAQFGGASAGQLWGNLIASGSFASITKVDFLALLKGMGEKQLIIQDGSGLLLPGELGERLINHYDFYAAFTSDEEFRLLRDGKSLGSLPVSKPLITGQCIIFGGRRWQVQHVDLEAKIIVVTAARGGQPPQFDGLSAQVDDRVRREMRSVLMETTACSFLDRNAHLLLEEARNNFRALGLGSKSIVGSAHVSHIATWRGDYTNEALAMLLRNVGIQCENKGLFLEVALCEEDTLQALRAVGRIDISKVEPLLENVENMIREKWDWTLPRSLLMKSFASSHLDFQSAADTARQLCQES